METASRKVACSLPSPVSARDGDEVVGNDPDAAPEILGHFSHPEVEVSVRLCG